MPDYKKLYFNLFAAMADAVEELETDAELKAAIAASAREQGMNDWICRCMGGYADAETIEGAIESGNWCWLSENLCRMDGDMQAKVALAAAQAQNWEWIEACTDRLSSRSCGLQLAMKAMDAGKDEFVVRLAQNFLLPDENTKLVSLAAEGEKWELLSRLAPLMEPEGLDSLSEELARAGKWPQVRMLVEYAETETIEKLMETAVDQGDFDAVDMLDTYL